jgi:hypothetical protein
VSRDDPVTPMTNEEMQLLYQANQDMVARLYFESQPQASYYRMSKIMEDLLEQDFFMRHH